MELSRARYVGQNSNAVGLRNVLIQAVQSQPVPFRAKEQRSGIHVAPTSVCVASLL